MGPLKSGSSHRAARSMAGVIAIVAFLAFAAPASALLTPVMKSVINGPNGYSLNKATVLIGTQVHQKTTLTGTGPTVTGTVDFLRFTNLTCTGTPAAVEAGVPLVNGAAVSSAFALPAGNHSFMPIYNGDANYSSMMGTCQLVRARFRILKIETEIHDENHNDITGTPTHAGTVIHDKAIITAINGPQPTGTVDFRFYTNINCTEPAAHVDEDVPLVNGEAESSEQVATEPGVSYRVFYSGDQTYQPHAGPCEKLPVIAPLPYRMTGGGSVFTLDGTRVTHGFALRCNALDKRQRLEINWDGNRFHLLSLKSATCIDSPLIVPNPPDADFDTYIGKGTGRYNGIPGASATWTFTDAGEPGTIDTATIEVKDANGMTVLLVVTNVLDRGNHQAHGE